MIDPDALREHLQRTLPRALAALREMVDVNSFTHNAAGVNRVGDLTAQLFEPLGFTAERPQAIECVASPRPPLGRHLLLSRSGASGPRVALIGHLDTVFAEEIEAANDSRWRESGDRIYGPGTVDMKGGNVLMWMVLDAIRALAPSLFDRTDWRPCFNAAEEGLASDFALLARAVLGNDARACLVFEGGDQEADTHYLINRRKGSVGLRAIATGRAAHAGSQHQRGANAIVQLSELITRLHQITDYTRDLTCNVGIIRGGTVANQVPDFAEALIEIRAYDPAILATAVDEAMKLDGLSTIASAADGYAARVKIDCRIRHAPWPENDATNRLVDLWQSCGKQIGMKVGGRSRGGLSDGNFLYDLAPTVDGLGPVGGNLHCATRTRDGSADQEFVLPSSFVPRAMLNVLAIDRLLSTAE